MLGVRGILSTEIVGEGLIHYGMIATGNHSDSDSLRGAPPSLNPKVPGLQLRCRISAVSNKSSTQLSCVEGGSRPSPTVIDYAVIASQFAFLAWQSPPSIGYPLRYGHSIFW